MAMGKRRKPTQKETIQVINSIIQELQGVQPDVRPLCGTLDMYIEYKNDQDGFGKHIDSKIIKEKDDDVQGHAEGSPAPVETSPQD